MKKLCAEAGLLGRVPLALGHIAIVMLICKAQLLRSLTSRLAAVGRMALSNYFLQTLINIFFYGIGLGFYGYLERYQLYYVVIFIWIVHLVVSPFWLAHYRFGPLEWAWRSLTYMKLQPMRRSARPTATPVKSES